MKITQKLILELAKTLEGELDGALSPDAERLYYIITSFVAEDMESQASKIRYAKYKELK